MTTAIDITGKVFGDLTVISLHERRDRRSHWLCRCKCGKNKIITLDSIRNGTKSCGCHRKNSHLKHGYARSKRYSSIYNIWSTMKARCLNKKSDSYKNYGGRGITVCDRWLKFENFLADMGERPDNFQIERIDNEKGYSPENCIWADKITQARNTRLNHLITVDGVTLPLAAWAEKIGRCESTVQRWCRLGLEVEGIRKSLHSVSKRYVLNKLYTKELLNNI